ncbi:MAG: thiamine-phosphate kinase [Flavobacteriia bacterium]|jgi:thiamine-monophosphate kinase|nr:thiamine-phosphate kinase [Flavobacteriia bacterium]
MDQKKEAQSIEELGEFGLIKRLVKTSKESNSSTVFSVGDDCAVLERNDQCYTLISKDVMLENIHFDLMYVPLKQLGFKAVSAAISDIYAMNGKAEQVLVAIAASSRFPLEALDDLYQGIHHACAVFMVDLVGGDTSSSVQGLMISVSAVGVVEKTKIAYRSGGKPNDILMVSGDLGRPYLGLQILEREKAVYLSNPQIQPELERFDALVKKQLMPNARKDVVELLANLEVIPTSMIDISDGLASELLHLCQSGSLGCSVYENKLPFHEETMLMSSEFNLTPLTCAMNGGEEYELLFSVSQEDFDKIKGNPYFTPIGYFTPKEEGRLLVDNAGVAHELKAQGWRHF